MKLKRITALYYSATGMTGKVVHMLGEALSESLALPLDCRSFTKPAERSEGYTFTPEDLVLAGSPTYAGRVPNKIAPDFREKLQGNGALAVGVVTFGNRAYDNALAELCDILAKNGFHTIAAGAFPVRHAFTDVLGAGRPDLDDKRQIREFAGRIAAKLNSPALAPMKVPGEPEAPYYIPKGLDGEPAKFLKAKPQTDLGKCCGCGVCVRVCPMGAIAPNDVTEIPGTCIKCQACVRKCTLHAKYFDDPAFLSHVAMLEKNFVEPKDCEIYL